MYNYTSPQKTASRALDISGIYLGTVTRSDSEGVFVSVEQVSPGLSFGPCLVTEYIIDAGDQVVCAFLNNAFDELVVLGRIV